MPVLEMSEREITAARAEMRWSGEMGESEFGHCLVATLGSISEGEGRRAEGGNMQQWVREEVARLCG
jgi:hypothetical protein